MKTPINNFCGYHPILVGGTVHPDPKIGPTVNITQSHGALAFQHAMTTEQAREMAKALNECADELERKPKFSKVSCSQCGGEFGPGDHGFSHCENHTDRVRAA